MTTLRNWIAQNELHLDTPVCEEILDAEGLIYSDRSGEGWWVSPLLVIHTAPGGTRALGEEEEANFRDWLDVDGNRPHDFSKPDLLVDA